MSSPNLRVRQNIVNIKFMSSSASRPGPLPAKLSLKSEVPTFEKSVEEIEKVAHDFFKKAQLRLDEIANQDLSKVSFESTVGALDDLEFDQDSTSSRIYLLQNVHPDAKIREAARKIHVKFQNWCVERAYNEKVYAAVKAYAEKNEPLFGEDKKLLDETMRDYRRIGMELDRNARKRLKSLKMQLSEIEMEFTRNINEHQDCLWVKKSRLKGLDEAVVEQFQKNEKGEYRISLEYPEYLPVMEHAHDEELRKELLFKKYDTAGAENPEILNKMVKIRNEIAALLGYSSWNEYVIEERMAKSPDRVFNFVEDLIVRLKTKAAVELNELELLKKETTKNPDAELKLWDYYYYSALIKKTKHQVDAQALKDYFELENVIEGMFGITKEIFGIKVNRVGRSSFELWDESAQLYEVIDEDESHLGYFCMDLFPREGKYNHAAVFPIIPGKYLSNGEYQRPFSVMVCNFPRPTEERKSLLSHKEVETLFHEFGHILHNILTRAKFCQFAGTRVAWDFVEAPSQVLENWAWDYEALTTFAKHHQSGEALPKDLVDRMNAAEKASCALFYLRQLSLAKSDLQIHHQAGDRDAVEIANTTMGDIFLSPPEGSHFAAGWGHMVGYASGYYGYAWADVMAADLFSKFETEGALNPEIGRKLRREIYEPGSSRDENHSLEAFLERPLSSQAFFEKLGAVAE